MSGWTTKEPTRIHGTTSSSNNNLASSNSTLNKTQGSGSGSGNGGGGGGWSSTSPKPLYSTTTESPSSQATMTSQVQGDRDINDVTKRMLKLVTEADEMANESLKGLETQNESIKKQQDEIAGMADELNVADRKIKGIRSFFSHLGNQFKKDNSGEHQKARQKYEKELAKTSFKTEAEKMKNDDRKHEEDFEQLQETQKQILEQNHHLLEQAKHQSKQEIKAVKKGNAQANGDVVVMGKFTFQSNELPGEQCEAENDLDQIGQYVKSLKTKAEAMNTYVDESKTRIEDLHTDLKDVQGRTVNATKKGEKIIKNDSFF